MIAPNEGGFLFHTDEKRRRRASGDVIGAMNSVLWVNSGRISEALIPMAGSSEIKMVRVFLLKVQGL